MNGLAEIVESDEETARLDELGMASWAGTEAGRVWVRIRRMSITGRRIAAGAASAPAPPASAATASAATKTLAEER